MKGLSGYLAILAVAAVVTFGLTFPVKRLARRYGAVVLPDASRIHLRPTPTLGGAGMFLAFLVAMIVASRLPQFKEVFSGSSEPLGVVLAGAVIFAVGLVDDLREVSPPAKMAGQVLAGSVLYFFGVTMILFKLPGGLGVLVPSPSILPLLTALWVVGMANAINFIDGLDGLAAGLVAIAAGSFAVYSLELVNQGSLSTDNIGPLLAVIACGVCLGFLPHNFHPARIFMGDAGALFVGLLLAASTSVVGGRTTGLSGHTYFFFAPLFIPLIILGVPVLDTALAIVRRTVRRSGVATRDLGHLHYRLIQLGYGHRRSVMILWAWTAILSGMVLYPVFSHRGNAVIPYAAVGLAVLLCIAFRPGFGRRTAVATPDSSERLAQVVKIGEARHANPVASATGLAGRSSVVSGPGPAGSAVGSATSPTSVTGSIVRGATGSRRRAGGRHRIGSLHDSVLDPTEVRSPAVEDSAAGEDRPG
ncbi:MAG: glycosyltransferase family 4 protein [Acidimicrobiales bacterium]